MKKRIIAASLCIVAVSFCFAACGKNKSYEENTTVTTIEYFTEADGEVYVTNVNGEHIPVTTNKDGYVELPEDLVTKTAEQVSKEKEEIKNEATATSTATTTSKSGQATTAGKVYIGSAENAGKDAVIDWR